MSQRSADPVTGQKMKETRNGCLPCESLLRGGNSIHLPLGLMGSAAVLLCFTTARATTMTLMAMCRQGHHGFPFMFETLLVFPFCMQCVFYSTQTFMQCGFSKGLGHIWSGLQFIVPCLVYSVFMATSPVLETYAMQFLSPSMCVVMKQLVLVNVALGEVLAFGERPSRMAWILIIGMMAFVALFQQVSATGSLEEADAGDLKKGLVPMLASTVIGGAGGILQQKFMQRQAQSVPLPTKLLYQHIIALILVPCLIASNPKERHRILTEGFFSGWNSWAYVTSACMWLWFLGASMVTANISAMAGCFASAVSVVLTGMLEIVFLGHHLSAVQFTLMIVICITAVVYTQVRLESKAQKPPDKGKYRPKLKEGKREVERRGDSDSD